MQLHKEKSSTPPYKFNWFDWFCLWYPPGWLILFNRHWQYYHCDPDGWNWLEYGLFLIPGGFYLALLLRWLRLGCRIPQIQVNQFEQNYQQVFRDEVLAQIVKYYFHGELRQVENLPQQGPLIVTMNHAGMCFPWDFLGLAYLLSQTRDWVIQPLAGISLFDHPLVIWWLPRGWAQALGGVRAEKNEFEAALTNSPEETTLTKTNKTPNYPQKNRTILLYAPEGLRGPGKGWQRRYQLETFDSSFVVSSERYQIPILPVVCLGNESLHPWTVNLKKLARRLSLPFLPVSVLMVIFIIFPSMGVWAMRSHLRYYIQPVYQGDSPSKFAGEQIQAQQTSPRKARLVAYQKAQGLRDTLQHQINQLFYPKSDRAFGDSGKVYEKKTFL